MISARLFLKMILCWLMFVIDSVWSDRISEEENRYLQSICGEQYPENRYKSFGGRALRKGEYPFASYIGLKFNDKRFICTGALISPRHILTASHCVMYRPSREKNYEQCVLEKDLRKFVRYPYNLQKFLIKIAGKSGLMTEVKINSIWSHEKWDDCDHEHDIAIIELKQNVPNDYAIPICLPQENEPLASVVKVVGMGLVPYAIGKNTVASTVTTFENPVLIESAMIKTTSIRRSTCQGDSGGPMIQLNKRNRLTVVGTTSSGTLDCTDPHAIEATDIENYFVDVRYHVEWICFITGVCPIHDIKDD
ncbi:trypsin [Dictyocaulus viviparus]|uniref:Trypsin n=1 Tax=Dictyocaulus viviparus TaxID=29172 RepID=A0A0D8XS46_DICVI|nr:trypsin [Dictyocaulus viviparus]